MEADFPCHARVAHIAHGPAALSASHLANPPCLHRPGPQDAFAARSHRLAAAAQAAGKFRDEIVPVATVLKDPKSGERRMQQQRGAAQRGLPGPLDLSAGLC